jgi:hypothetical protein
MQKEKIKFLVCAVLFLLNSTCLKADTNNFSATLDVNLQTQTDTNVELKVTLKNDGSKTFHIYADKDPSEIYSMTVVVVESDNPIAPPLKQIYITADGLPFPLTEVKKGESISGTIPLSGNFPELCKTLKEWDVIVFWSYPLKTHEGYEKRLSGSLVIPKREKSLKKKRSG